MRFPAAVDLCKVMTGELPASGSGITFIVLDSEAEGQKFRHVLEEALSKATK